MNFYRAKADTAPQPVSLKGSGYENEESPADNVVAGATAAVPSVENFAAKVVAHLPDQVVTADQNKGLPYQVSQQGVLMFLDISGFTALTEKYSMNAKNGTDQLTKTLNNYMDALVTEIISNDGDVLEFAGDAILSVWHVENFVGMKITVAQVIKCAMNVQRKCGKFDTSVGVVLRVKIGISAGEVLTTYLGTKDFCHYVTSGRAVESVNAAEHYCVSGDIVLSPSAWVHCAGFPINVEIQDDSKHRKIIDDPEEEDDNEKLAKLTASSQYNVSRIVSVDIGVYNSLKGKAKNLNEATVVTSERTWVRKTVMNQYSMEDLQHMQQYLSPPVKKKLKAGQPLEYLNEMRQVTIAFMNLDLYQSTRYEMSQTLQQAFRMILNNLMEVEGLLNKMFMFDKGCTFLAIFGLPGFKHDNDCARALQCAYKIQQDLSVVSQIRYLSVGVTTGSTYCGVMGHEFRHEYTVIGRKVNMAARLMMHYPGKVTCDNETYHHSKMIKANFHLLEVKQMKGLKNVGTIREYKETKGHVDTLEILRQQEDEFPLVGRETELKVIDDHIRALKFPKETPRKVHIIAVKGDTGSGKSRLLDAMIVKCAKATLRVVFTHIERNDNQPFLAAKLLLLELLGFDVCRPHQEREKYMFDNFSDPVILENMALLNNLLYLKLKWNEAHRYLRSEDIINLTAEVLKRVIIQMTDRLGNLIFAIDDAHYMDPESWQLIDNLGVDGRSLVLLTMKSPIRQSMGRGQNLLMNSNTVLQLSIGGLENSLLTALACQFLGVVSIPKALEKLLVEKSHGVPSWCEQLVYSMLYDGYLAVVPAGSVTPMYEMVSPPALFLTKKLSSRRDTDDTKSSRRRKSAEEITETTPNSSEEKKICIIPSGKSLDDVRVPDSIRGMIQAQIDRMDDSEQQIIKTSAVLGKVFSRDLLQHVLLRKMHAVELNAHLLSIAEHGIFECGSPPNTTSSESLASYDDPYLCYCKQTANRKLYGAIWDCRLFAFKSGTVQETAYEMYTESLRRKIHIRAGKYLESQAHRCDYCGGQNFQGSEQRTALAKARSTLAGDNISSYIDRRASVLSEDLDDDEKNLYMVVGKHSSTSASTAVKTIHTIRKSSFQRESILSNQARRESVQKEVDEEDDPAGMWDKNKRISINPDIKAHVDATHLKMAQAEVTGRRRSLAIHAPKSRRETKDSLRAFDQEKMADAIVSGKTKQKLDMRECHCLDILLAVYPQLVRHWKHAGNMQRMVTFLMEAATASIAVDDNAQAVGYLKEVQHIKEHCHKGQNPYEGEVSFVEIFTFDQWDEVRLESLIGQALYHMGQIEESLPHFYRALGILGATQPTSKIAVVFSIMSEGIRQWKHQRWPRDYIGTAGPQLGPRMIEQARCLSHVFHDYMENSTNSNRALLAVLQQLNKAEEVGTDTQELIIAYTCMMECCQSRHWSGLGKWYEVKAHELCSADSENSLDVYMAMVHLFATSMYMRLSWGEIPVAIESGYKANAIATKLHDNDMRIQILPILCQALMLSNRIPHAIDSLKELEYTDNECEAVIGKTLYCCCCVDLLLEYGLQLERFAKCIKFAHLVKKNEVFRSDPIPMYHFACSLRLWCQRRLMFEEAANWQTVADSWQPKGSRASSLTYIKGYLKELECNLIELANMVNQRNAHLVKRIKNSIKASFKFLNRVADTLPLWKPRILHYEAYYQAIIDNKGAAKREVSKCIKLAKKMQNNLEVAWAEHSLMVWYDPSQEKTQNAFWALKGHSARPLDWHAIRLAETKLILYSLPLPHWL